jgi:hypothetical protein
MFYVATDESGSVFHKSCDTLRLRAAREWWRQTFGTAAPY